MPLRLNKRAFEGLITENIEWLLGQPRTLERDHIENCLKAIPNLEYDLRWELDSAKKRTKEAEARAEMAEKELAALKRLVARADPVMQEYTDASAEVGGERT